MNISISVDDVSLATSVAEVLAYDDEGEPYKTGNRTVGDLVADQLVARITRDDGYGDLARRVRQIREEMIREAIAPQVAEAIARPLKLTNRYGEKAGATTTLTELIIDEARKVLKQPVDNGYGRDRQTYLQKTVAEEVKQALGAEIADAVKAARDQVSAEIGDHVAAAVKAGLKAR